MDAPRLSWRRKAAFSLLTLLLAFALLEGGLRLWHVVRDRSRPKAKGTFNPAALFEPHPYICYVANAENPEHTRDGFRSKHEIELAREGWRILCMGGSSTYDTRCFEEDSFPRQLERALEQDAVPAPEVLNGGLGGWATHNLIGFLSLRAVDYKPDICIFYCGFNDAWNRILFPGFRTDNSNAQRPWSMPTGRPWWRRSVVLNALAVQMGSTDPAAEHIHTICWNPEGGDPEENWRSSSFEAYRRNLRTLVAICRAHSIRPVFCTQATDFDHHPTENHNDLWAQAMEETTRELRAAAEELETPLIDIRTPMSNHAKYFADCLHMNEVGNRERARLVAEWIRANRLLEGQPRTR